MECIVNKRNSFFNMVTDIVNGAMISAGFGPVQPQAHRGRRPEISQDGRWIAESV
jgi:hypothetical protein